MPFTLTGADVRTLRTSVGATQADLARALGYTRAAICKWERRASESIPRTQYERVLAYLNHRRDADDEQRAMTQRIRSA